MKRTLMALLVTMAALFGAITAANADEVVVVRHRPYHRRVVVVHPHHRYHHHYRHPHAEVIVR